MGACQSYFGASTSGQGMTATQFAACIRAAAAQSHTLETLAKIKGTYLDTTEEFKKRTGTSINDEKLTPEDIAKTNHTVTIESQKANLEITSFAGDIFRQLRFLEGITDEFFDREWVLPEDHLGLKESEGRSRALFLVSNHRCLLAKTVSEGEVMTLLGMLPDLCEHLIDNPNSLLQRFVLAMRITNVNTKEIGWVVVFTDIFAKCPAIHEKWDLKGRQPKAAKYLFFPPANEIPPSESDTEGDDDDESSTEANKDAGNVADEGASSAREYKRKKSKKQQNQQFQQQQSGMASPSQTTGAAADLTSPGQNPNLECDAIDNDTEHRIAHTKVYGDGYERVVARKDKELTRVFWIPKKFHSELQAIIKKDSNFLASQGILDYSVLIGVKYSNPEAVEQKFVRFNALYHPKSVDESGNTNNNNNSKEQEEKNETTTATAAEFKIPCETRNTCDGVQMNASSLYHNGIPSSASLEQYYIGIIDMLTSYTFLKKSANFWKNCLWNDATLSTVPPPFYKERIVDFMEKCIVVGPDAKE
jgi:hypothetical protein